MTAIVKVPASIPFGRLHDMLEHPDATLLAFKPGRGVMDDYIVKRYASRLALETFLKNPGGWCALVKTPTPAGILVHPAFQSPV